uniref:Swi5-dependent recombination DNA repair protein 1 homolog n=1 Tax=Bos indicus x Bos taurus TaxID=30522 RepID=A0A4W2HM94_BOBOX
MGTVSCFKALPNKRPRAQCPNSRALDSSEPRVSVNWANHASRPFRFFPPPCGVLRTRARAVPPLRALGEEELRVNQSGQSRVSSSSRAARPLRRRRGWRALGAVWGWLREPMSATLRERLRKTRSSFNSCYSVVKRLKVESEENDQTFSEKSAPSTEESCLEFHENFKHIDSEFEESTCLKDTFKNINVCESKSLDTESCSDLQNDFMNENLAKHELNKEKAKLMKQIQEKEDLLRRLKLVKMYRSKNDLSQLQLLIEKWRSCSQQLLYELQSAMSEENKKLSLTQLIDHYGLDDKLLHYNRNEEEFIGV